MRFLMAFFAVLLFGGTMLAQSNQVFDCGAEPSPEARAYLQRTHTDRLNSLQDGNRSIHVVKIAIHIIRTSSGTLGISEANVDSRIATANERYKDANIVLETCGPYNYIDNSTYSTFNKGTDETIRTANDVPGAINIYFANSVLSGTTSICGYAKFPTATTASTGTNFTVVKNSCNESSFVHELGHCFGLLHTHDTGAGAEEVDRTSSGNCATAGDGFCDTPADPNISGLVTTGCVYTGTATDANGDTYVPDPNNIMSYSYKPCRTEFSPSQMSAVHYSANNDYVLSKCENGPITCSTYRASFPYREGFETSALPTGWAQDTGDDGDWTRRSGSTPSTGTGPTSAQSGTYYHYVEATTGFVGHPNKEANLMGPCFTSLNASTCYVSFYYHMYGAGMGDLDLQLSYDEGNSWNTLWSKSGDQGNSWKYAFVSLTDYLEQPSMRLRWHATTGSSFTSDIAIDNVYLVRNTLSGYAELPYLDGFEDGSFNSFWNTSSTSGFGRVQVTSANQPGGDYHATMDVTTNGNYSTNRMDLGVQLAYYSSVEMSFDWKEFNDENNTEDGVYLSVNGGSSYTKIHDLTGGTSQYQRITLDIKALATAAGLTLTDNSKIRFQQRDNFSITTDGFAFDNILINDPTADIDEEAFADAFGAPADESYKLAEPMIEGLDFYPNPFTGHMNISIEEGYGTIEQLGIYDLTGRAIYETTDVPSGQVLEIGQDLDPGVYMVRVRAQGTVDAFKAIKTK